MKSRALGCLLAWTCALAWIALPARARADDARIVLLGAAALEPLLATLLSESLRSAALPARLEVGTERDCEAWARAAATDPRVLLCIAFDGQHRALVSLRGPHQQSPQTRALWLAHGLDELGRETIVHVVELSLGSRWPPLVLETGSGSSADAGSAQPTAAAAQDTAARPTASPKPTQPVGEPGPVAARAAGEATRANTVATPGPRAPAQGPPSPSFTDAYEVAARGAFTYAGPALDARWSAGVELLRALYRTPDWALRARLGLEYGLPGRLRTGVASAQLQSSALRLGVEWARRTGSAQSVTLGVGAGLELVQISDLRVAADWQPARSQRVWTSLVRAELGYALTWAVLRIRVVAFIDCGFTDLRFDALQDAERIHLATPWRLQPGIGLALGM